MIEANVCRNETSCITVDMNLIYPVVYVYIVVYVCICWLRFALIESIHSFITLAMPITALAMLITAQQTNNPSRLK